MINNMINMITLMTISRPKTMVKTLLHTERKPLSVEEGGMLGRSMASVMQFSPMNIRIVLSKYFFDTMNFAIRRILSMIQIIFIIKRQLTH